MVEQYFNISVEAMLLLKQKTWAWCRNDWMEIFGLPYAEA